MEDKRESNQQRAAEQPTEGSREATDATSLTTFETSLTTDESSLTIAVAEQHTLTETGVFNESTLMVMEVSSSQPSTSPLHPVITIENDFMPDVLTVLVQTDEGDYQELMVEIEHPCYQKRFLGGYRHQLTGVEYHHAAVQTLQKKRPDRGVQLFSRDTQTVELRCQEQQCAVDVSTQMTRVGCFVSCCQDKLVSPGNYATAGDYQEWRLRAVICLQSFVRRWLAQQKVGMLKMERDHRLAWENEQVRRRQEEKRYQMRERHQRWSNPQRQEDFNDLYRSVAKWRMMAEQQICSTLTGAEKTAALCSLVQQETQHIAAIGRLQIKAKASNHDSYVRRLLDKSAAPHRWPAAGGKTIEVDNQQIRRARELRDVYNSIIVAPESSEQRVCMLKKLRDTVQEDRCQLTEDIMGLINREVDLMKRGVRSDNLEGLRKRISTLFLQYIKKPEVNPEVSKLLEVPQSPSQKIDTLFCQSCHRVLLSTKFNLPAGSHQISRCRRCTALDSVARTRKDVCSYKNMLLRLRVEEQQLNKEARITFLLQVEDVQYLVEDVWTFCSAFKDRSDLDALDFVRWDRRRDWSPWNCILLPTEETSSHLEVKDLHKVYKAVFIRSIEYRHLLAWRHFRQNPALVEYLSSHPAAGLNIQLLSSPVSTTTDEQAAVTSSAT
eukprot:XP_011605401.1 PREDICTED: IQ and ubiquitin-like domain-containing protein [Takifugu rubripes]